MTQSILCLAMLLITLPAFAETNQLFGRGVRLDGQGKLLSWITGESPYDTIVTRAWTAFESIPVQSNGYRTYIDYPTFRGPNDPDGPPFSGKIWAHNPAGLFAMLTDGAILYHAYSGDTAVLDRVRDMLDHMLVYGTTGAKDYWALCPYSSSDAGNPVFRGGTDTLYCDQENYTPCGRADGPGFLEPDKIGELGFAYLQFYEVTEEKRYLQAATHCANALAAHVRAGDESHSPWPFRVDAKTGTLVREDYTANTIGPIRLFDELIRINKGDVAAYRRADEMAWNWLMKYPMQNMIWCQYFEDVLIYPDYRVNRNQYSALETARYLLQHPEKDPQALAHAKRLIDWVTGVFARDSRTMGGLPEKGTQWGAEVLSEQINDMDKMTSHTARYASVRALWSEVAGDLDSRERAFRSFNWCSYSERDDGLVKTSVDEGTGYWFSDGYGDYARHFLRGMASAPEWAPVHQAHLLGSSSIVQSIRYRDHNIGYLTYDKSSQEILKLPGTPASVYAGAEALSQVKETNSKEEGYSVKPLDGGGFAVKIKHRYSGNVTVRWN